MEKACGLYPCRSRRLPCKGRLLLPCDLMKKLQFGSVPSHNVFLRDSALPFMEWDGENSRLLKEYKTSTSHRQTRSAHDELSQTTLCENAFPYSPEALRLRLKAKRCGLFVQEKS
ncbi:unnamed protein product [Anisakis simplex]|uniref:Homeobox domain-containing protein n=1 Tax=Anisakis simplex TaxID=6269 RepID=A0A0M3JIU3_ANISI|nr:unnamed protein product [Anisakis simplex]